MIINYIYNKSGQIEYIVIPFDVWDSIKRYETSTEIKNEKKPDFDPTEFIGMLSHHHFDLENELQEIRIQWQRDLV